jgi:hypothetical protein
MNELQLNSDPAVDERIKSYPKKVQEKLRFLRKLILEAAHELELQELEETLKWGEPSYLVKKGSTIRMDWKEKKPDYYAMYFKCTSKLVPSFKVAYGDCFSFEGNRAIEFKMDDDIPSIELKECIKAALQYHKVKQLPLLGL